MHIRIGTIIAAEKVAKKVKKLLKLTIDDGLVRTHILSGIMNISTKIL
jgi:tRNA-binding EMAP/Myf-like protein